MKRPRPAAGASTPDRGRPDDASFRRALVKKLRRAQATLEEHRRAAAGSNDAFIIDDEKRRDAARTTIETTLKRIADAFGANAVRDDDVRAALGDDAVVAAEVNAKRRSEGDARRRERERLDAEEKAQRRREKGSGDGDGGGRRGGESQGVWALHAMAKSAGEAEASTTTTTADAADACARDAEFAKTRAVSAGMWAVAKISSALKEEGDEKRGDGVRTSARALGRAMNALAKRCARLESSDVDARGASGALWSLATTARTPTGAHVDDVLARRATNFAATALNACASRANAQDAANALWGAAKLRKALEESCVQSLVDALAKPGAEVKTEELSIALWAIATLGNDGLANATSLAMPLVRKAKETAKKQPKSWSAQATANAAWAGGKLATADGATETDVRDARQMVTQLFAIAKTLNLTAQGFAHVARACASVETEARLVADLAKFVVAGLKTHERTLTGADLASVVEACQTLKLHTSMSDGAKLVEEVRRAVERDVDAFDWQAVGRLDVAIEGVVGDKIEGELRRKLNARGVAACAEVDEHRLDLEKGSADALLNTADETSALVAPMDNPTLLVVDDKHRLITKRLRRVGWQTTTWQRFSCGEHVEGSCWPESDDKDWFGAAVVRAPTTKASLAMILHVVAARVQFGGKVWIYGAVTEGLKSIIPDLPKVRASRRRPSSSSSSFSSSFFCCSSSSLHRHTLSRANTFVRGGGDTSNACYINDGSRSTLLTQGPSNPERASSVCADNNEPRSIVTEQLSSS